MNMVPRRHALPATGSVNLPEEYIAAVAAIPVIGMCTADAGFYRAVCTATFAWWYQSSSTKSIYGLPKCFFLGRLAS
jgi:hypothetical protein